MEISQEILDILKKNLNIAYEEGYKVGYAAGQNNIPKNDKILFPVHNCIVDLSSYDPAPDYEKLCNNTDFIILRARYCNKTDTTFEERAKELNARNMPFAVYDYLTLSGKNDANRQAEKIYELCKQYNPRIYYLDTEQLATGITYAQEREFIKTYVARLRELGVETIGHYSGDWLYSTYYWQIQDIFDTVWIASYGKNNGLVDESVVLKSAQKTNKIDLHQYTDKGKIPGTTKIGDLNRLTNNKPLSWFTERDYE